MLQALAGAHPVVLDVFGEASEALGRDLWDLASRGRLHPATLWAGLLVLAAAPLRMALADSPAWLAIARWLTSLVA
jgi:hypothetical protein